MDHRTTLKAFTLIEALVTLAIVGSLFAIALPLLSPTLKRVEKEQKLFKAKAFLLNAQKQARDFGACVEVSFDNHVLQSTRRDLCTLEKTKKMTSLLLSLDNSFYGVLFLPSGRALHETKVCADDLCLSIALDGTIEVLR